MVKWGIEAERQNPEPSSPTADALPLWRIELLGGDPRAVPVGEGVGGGGVLARFPTQKTAALLALLALAPGRARPRDEIIALLWPDAESGAARDRLSQALVWLRPRLEPPGVERGHVHLADRRGVALATGRVTSDVAALDAALAEARRGGSGAHARDALLRAVGLYRGDLLPAHYDDWVLAERRRLRDACLEALRLLTALYEADGDYERAAGFARRATAVDALDEGAHADLIRLLGASGQAAAALRQFRALTDLLARELGAAPSAATLALVERIRAAGSEGLTAAAAAGVPPARPRAPDPLPTPLTRFFGREDEIARVRDAVLNEGARLVTITGPGGAGKTRLALAAAREMASAFAGALAFAPLADVEDPRTIPATLAAALGLPAPPAGVSLDAVAEALREGPPFLLVLDNLEHLLGGAVAVVRELLARAPTTTLLVTSRQRLGVDGEREVPLPPLPLPPASLAAAATTREAVLASPSVRLFVDRARAVRPDFAVTPDNADAVARVCARLEGIPLAIELCAAWAQTLTPAQMLDSLSQRFDLLVSRRADITPRHRTLRAALEYSYLLLPADLRALFAGLSVFRGGWSLEAAVAVCGGGEGDAAAVAGALPMLAGLTELRERSLVVAEEEGEAVVAEMRYRMLETLREFASDLLPYADREARRAAHAAYFLRLAERDDGAGMTGPEPERWLSLLDRERENLRAALAWSLETPEAAREVGLRLGVALGRYWAVRGPLSEGSRWLRALLERSGEG
ncbi:MAG TPA: BTAD domain-containing putative transcriptional regulator, partial [Armatimonadaceae bacterium]|nr:BTAD domain-containing putative transcriptional regulator [Armatimonadaceae bacterium]